MSTIKPDLYKKVYQTTIKGRPTQLTLNVWDTPGGAEYQNMRDLDFQGADACVMVYAIDKESTFKEMEGVHSLAMEYCNPLFFLVGNKVDLDRDGERAVLKEDGTTLKKDYKLTHFVETNA